MWQTYHDREENRTQCIHAQLLAQAKESCSGESVLSLSGELPSPRRELEEGTMMLSRSLAEARPPRLSEMTSHLRLELVA